MELWAGLGFARCSAGVKQQGALADPIKRSSAHTLVEAGFVGGVFVDAVRFQGAEARAGGRERNNTVSNLWFEDFPLLAAVVDGVAPFTAIETP